MAEQNSNLFARYQPQFDKQGGNELLCTELDHSYSYDDISTTVAKLAHVMTDIGTKPGDRVSVQVEKSPESLCLYLACLQAGFVYHPLNPGYKAGELEYFLHNADPSVVICDPQNSESIRPIARADGIRNLLTLDAKGGGSLMDEAKEAGAEFETIFQDKNDLAALLYSSGTTGHPKGIMLTHENLYANMNSLQEAWAFSSADRLLHALPVFHVHGLFVALGCVLLSGASMRWLPTYKVRDVIKYLPE